MENDTLILLAAAGVALYVFSGGFKNLKGSVDTATGAISSVTQAAVVPINAITTPIKSTGVFFSPEIPNNFLQNWLDKRPNFRQGQTLGFSNSLFIDLANKYGGAHLV